MKYSMTPPSSASQISVLLILLLLLCLAAVLFAARYCRLEINDGALNIKAALYSTKVDLADLNIEEIRVTNLKEEGIKIFARTNGIGLPGLSVGWFSGGGKKYKLYLTDRTKVLYIPTKLGYDLIFSTRNGEEIIRDIKTVR